MDTPEYKQHRKAVATADGASVLEESKHAFNAKGFERLCVQVLPAGGANPSVEVMFWSDAAGKFISAHTALTFAGKGANTAYEITVDVYGRKTLVSVTAIAAGTVDVHVAGFRPAPR